MSNNSAEKCLWISYWVITGILVSAIILVAPFAWIMRDGLGPDSRASNGFDALWNWFTCLFWGPAFLLLLASQLLISVKLGKTQEP